MDLDKSYDEKVKAPISEQDCDDKPDNQIMGTKFKEYPFTIKLRIPEGFEFEISEINVTQYCGEVVITMPKIVAGTKQDTDPPHV